MRKLNQLKLRNCYRSSIELAKKRLLRTLIDTDDMAVYYCSALIDQGNHNSLGKLIFSFSTKDRLEIQSVILNFCYHFCNLWNENQVQRNEVCLKQILSAIELMPSRQLDHFKVLFILSSLNKKEREKSKEKEQMVGKYFFYQAEDCNFNKLYLSDPCRYI